MIIDLGAGLILDISPVGPTNTPTITVTNLSPHITQLLISVESDGSGAPFVDASVPRIYSLKPNSENILYFAAGDFEGNETGVVGPVRIVHDSLAPTLSITAQPALFTTDDDPDFQLSVADERSGVARIEARLDGGEWIEIDATPSWSDLGDGHHHADFRVIDAAGNQSIKSWDWNIDLTAPTVQILNGPEQDGILRFKGSDGTGSGVVKYLISINGGATVQVMDEQFFIGDLGSGQHSISVRAVDALGLQGEIATYDWVQADPNHAPEAHHDSASAVQGQVLSRDEAHGVLSNDTDEDSNSLTITGVEGNNGEGTVGSALLGRWGSLTLNEDGSYSYAPSAPLLSSAPFGQKPVDIFTYTISDGAGGTSTATLQIEVSPMGITWTGSNKADNKNGTAGDDRISGENGNDVLFAGAGNDQVFGGNGEDRLHGGFGDDLLNGGNGRDSLNAGAGNNTLVGGNGPDVFVFGTDATGQNLISDFKLREDRLSLEAGVEVIDYRLTAQGIELDLSTQGQITLAGIRTTDMGLLL